MSNYCFLNIKLHFNDAGDLIDFDVDKHDDDSSFLIEKGISCTACNQIHIVRIGTKVQTEIVKPMKEEMIDESVIVMKSEGPLANFEIDLIEEEVYEENVEVLHDDSLMATSTAAADSKVRFPCKECDRTFSHPSNLGRHVRFKHQESGKTCPYCGKLFHAKYFLEEHILINHTEGVALAYECDLCKRKYRHRTSIRNHMRFAHLGVPRPPAPPPSGEKEVCPMCGRLLSTKGALRNHIRLHTGERPHLCSICGHEFLNRGRLQAHQKTHQDRSSREIYPCAYCERSFFTKHIRDTHERSHLGIVYQCEQCQLTFANKQNLKRHEDAVHKKIRPFQCNQCERSFSQKVSLDDHMARHQGLKKYLCEWCPGSAFTERSALKSHVERFHHKELQEKKAIMQQEGLVKMTWMKKSF